MIPTNVISYTAIKHFVKTSADVATTLIDTELFSSGSLPKEALITVEGDSIRFTVEKTSPTQGVEGSGAIGHILSERQSILLSNPANIKNFAFISQSSGVPAVVQITLFY